MEFSEYIEIIKRKKQTIVSVAVLFLVLALILTFIQPFKYEANSKILVVQSYEPGMDPFQVSKSNAYITKTLAKVVGSNSFYQEVLNSGFSINKSYFTEDLKKQIKLWNKTVYAGHENDSGIINLSVYHKDKYQADQIIRAVNLTLKSKHSQYHGAGNSVAISVIDQPLVSSIPVKPNIAFNILLAAVLGLISALSYIYLFPGQEHDLSLVPFKKKYRIKSKNQDEDNYPYNDNQDVAEAIARLKSAANRYNQAESLPGMDHVYSKDNRQAEQIRPAYEDDLGYEDIIRQGSMNNLMK